MIHGPMAHALLLSLSLSLSLIFTVLEKNHLKRSDKARVPVKVPGFFVPVRFLPARLM